MGISEMPALRLFLHYSSARARRSLLLSHIRIVNDAEFSATVASAVCHEVSLRSARLLIDHAESARSTHVRTDPARTPIANRIDTNQAQTIRSSLVDRTL